MAGARMYVYYYCRTYEKLDSELEAAATARVTVPERARGGPGITGMIEGTFFGLWSVCFPPALVRTARRLPDAVPVEALCESGVLVSLAGYPRGGAPGPAGIQV